MVRSKLVINGDDGFQSAVICDVCRIQQDKRLIRTLRVGLKLQPVIKRKSAFSCGRLKNPSIPKL